MAIDTNSFVRLASIGATSETIQDVLNPSGRCRAEPKHCAASTIAAKDRRPKEIPRAVRFQIRVSVFAVVLFKAKNNICCRSCSGDQRHHDNEKWNYVLKSN